MAATGAHARVLAVDSDTSDRVTASYWIPTVEVAVQEAIYNAIDAQARCIKARIDLAQASFEIADDGGGIDPDALCDHIFESSASSNRTEAKKSYGKHGQYLVAVAVLAQEVEIESRVPSEKWSYRKLVQSNHVAFNARAKVSSQNVGTTLRVRNLYWQLPVRQRDLAAQASTRSKIARSLSTFFHSLSMIWPSLSIDVSYTDDKVPRCSILGVASCEARLHSIFGNILSKELEYLSFDSMSTPFTVRGYVGVINDGSDGCTRLESPGWRQARAYYQFVFLDNSWVEDFHRLCCKTINNTAQRLQLGIPLFVLKISSKTHEYDIHSDGSARAVHFRHPEQLPILLREFVESIAQRQQEKELADEHLKVDPPGEMEPPDEDTTTEYAHDMEEKTRTEWSEYDTTYQEDVGGMEAVYDGHDGECRVDYAEEYYHDQEEQEEQEYEYAVHDDGGPEAFDFHRSDAHSEEQELIWVTEDSAYCGYEQEGPWGYDYQYESGCVECASCGSHLRQPRERSYVQPLDYRGHTDTELVDPNVYYSASVSYDHHSTADIESSWPEEADYSTSQQRGDPPAELQHRPSSLPKRGQAFDQLFFGHGAILKSTVPSRHKPPQVTTNTPSTQPTPATDSAWLSSHRVGGARRQLHLSQDTSKDPQPRADDPPTLLLLDPAAASDYVSEYFSIDRMRDKYRSGSSRLPLRALSSRRVAITGDLPDSPATSIRVGSLPQSLHDLPPEQMALDRSVFQRLEVIKQVDRKFILAKVEYQPSIGGDTTLLLCIDQHAADERVRLEQLEAQVFGPNGDEKNVDTMDHDPPIPVALNPREAETLAFFHEEISAWGFHCEVDEQSHTILMHRTPRVERRVATASDFREYLHLLAGSHSSVARRVLRPPALTRFLHSRACRSAIMFGDYLSLSQCRDLMEQLSSCRLPFQCAHGRPSIVPLVELQCQAQHGK